MLNLEALCSTLGRTPFMLRDCCGHFSQNGEDVIVCALLERLKTKGIFVDIGAYHPYRFSNTFMLYLQGWRGVNVDGNRNAIELFKEFRPEDVSVHTLVGATPGQRRYFKFEEGAFNTALEETMTYLTERNLARYIGEETLPMLEINELFSTYVGDQEIDFLNMDVEGMDRELLYALDLKRYHPKIIAVEIEPSECAREGAPLCSYLAAKGYCLRGGAIGTSILVDAAWAATVI